jgi:hypothetical protein
MPFIDPDNIDDIELFLAQRIGASTKEEFRASCLDGLRQSFADAFLYDESEIDVAIANFETILSEEPNGGADSNEIQDCMYAAFEDQYDLLDAQGQTDFWGRVNP